MKTKAARRKRRPDRSRPLRLLVADDEGRFYDHPSLLAAGQSWQDFQPMEQGGMAEPEGLQMVYLPGRLPVGVDPKTHEPQTVDSFQIEGRTITPHAVGAVLPPGHLRHLLPACQTGPQAPALPLRAYTAVGLRGDDIRVAASRIDRHQHWDPARFQDPNLPAKVGALKKRFPRNDTLAQLSRCTLQYYCCTASNVFLGTFEGALPSSPSCNANCVGCISEQDGPVDSPQKRLNKAARVADLVELAVWHLEQAKPAMVSFGQGCEGEPTCEAERIARAIRQIRAQTDRGAIHMNTNGSHPETLADLAAAGLQSVRVSLFSALPRSFDLYHRADFGLEQVESFICQAVQLGLFVSLNLLVFPGFSDRPEQIEALLALLGRSGAHMVQCRNLDLDPDSVMALLPQGQKQPLGIKRMLSEIERGAPGIELGSFNRFKNDWPPIIARRKS